MTEKVLHELLKFEKESSRETSKDSSQEHSLEVSQEHSLENTQEYSLACPQNYSLENSLESPQDYCLKQLQDHNYARDCFKKLVYIDESLAHDANMEVVILKVSGIENHVKKDIIAKW